MVAISSGNERRSPTNDSYSKRLDKRFGDRTLCHRGVTESNRYTGEQKIDRYQAQLLVLLCNLPDTLYLFSNTLLKPVLKQIITHFVK